MHNFIAEFLRKFFFALSSFFTALASGGFDFLGIHYDAKSNKLMVKYVSNHITIEEEFKIFVRSHYFKLLSNKQINYFFETYLEFASQHKTFELFQDSSFPELFRVKNTLTNKVEDKLVKDIVADDGLLENMSGKDVRRLMQMLPAHQFAGDVIEVDIDDNVVELVQ